MNIAVFLALYALLILAAFWLSAVTKGFTQRPLLLTNLGIGLARLTASLQTPRGDVLALANLGADSFAGSKRFLTDAAVGTRYLLGKKGSDIDHIAICGASDEPYVVITDEATAAEKEVTGEFLATAQRTLPMVASEAITIGDDVYTAASGKVQDEPAVAGTYFKVGTAVQAAGADGDQFAVLPCAPIKVVVIAAFTSTNGTAAAASANLANLAAEAEKIGDDVRALGAALATPALVKVLAA